MRRALAILNDAATTIIFPGHSPKFYAAISTPGRVLVLKNDGKLQCGESLDSEDLRDVNLDPSKYRPNSFSSTAIPRPYANFSSESWSKFLSFLNPVIVGNLKPNADHRRHLLDVYNPCLSNDAITLRNRSSIFGSLPLTRHLLLEDDFADRDYQARRLECLQEIDLGAMSPAQILQKYFKDENRDSRWATDRFLQRVSFAPSLHSVRHLGELLAEAAKKKGSFDEDAYKVSIQHIPYSHINPTDFEKMWKTFESIADLQLGAKATSQILVNIGKDWEKNKIEFKTHGKSPREYFAAIAKDLLVPIFFEKLQNDRAAQGQSPSTNLDDLPHVSYVTARMSQIVEEKITALTTPSKLADLVDNWSPKRQSIDSFKPMIKNYIGDQNDAWHPLIPNQKIDGTSFSVLTSHNDLLREKEVAQHCVGGGYVLMCKSGECHLISGLTASNEGFTMDLRRSNSWDYLPFRMHDLAGSGDYPCSQEAQKTAYDLLDKINSGEIAISKKLGAVEEPKDLKTWLQFDPLDAKERQSVFAPYQDFKILPNQWLKYESLEELIGKTGIGEQIDKVVRMESLAAAEFLNDLGQEIDETNRPSPSSRLKSYQNLLWPKKAEVEVIELFSEKNFGDLFEELPAPPTGKENFVRVISKRELVSRANEDAQKTEVKNARYIRCGQTDSIDQLGLLKSTAKLLSGNMSFLFEIDLKSVCIVTDLAAIGNSADPDRLLYLRHATDEDEKNGISNSDKLKKLTSAVNDCMVSISSEDYKKARLLLPPQVSLTHVELAKEMLNIFAMQRRLGNANPGNFTIAHEDKIYQIKEGRERVVEEILIKKSSEIEKENSGSSRM